MKYYCLFAAVLGVAVAQNAMAQLERPSLEVARRATRCSVIYGTVAKEAELAAARATDTKAKWRSVRVREVNASAQLLSVQLALLGTSEDQVASWLDEMDADYARADASTVLAMRKDCTSFWKEQRKAFRVLEQERTE